jgi:hypothetical protein
MRTDLNSSSSSEMDKVHVCDCQGMIGLLWEDTS